MVLVYQHLKNDEGGQNNYLAPQTATFYIDGTDGVKAYITYNTGKFKGETSITFTANAKNDADLLYKTVQSTSDKITKLILLAPQTFTEDQSDWYQMFQPNNIGYYDDLLAAIHEKNPQTVVHTGVLWAFYRNNALGRWGFDKGTDLGFFGFLHNFLRTHKKQLKFLTKRGNWVFDTDILNPRSPRPFATHNLGILTQTERFKPNVIEKNSMGSYLDLDNSTLFSSKSQQPNVKSTINDYKTYKIIETHYAHYRRNRETEKNLNNIHTLDFRANYTGDIYIGDEIFFNSAELFTSDSNKAGLALIGQPEHAFTLLIRNIKGKAFIGHRAFATRTKDVSNISYGGSQTFSHGRNVMIKLDLNGGTIGTAAFASSTENADSNIGNYAFGSNGGAVTVGLYNVHFIGLYAFASGAFLGNDKNTLQPGPVAPFAINAPWGAFATNKKRVKVLIKKTLEDKVLARQAIGDFAFASAAGGSGATKLLNAAWGGAGVVSNDSAENHTQGAKVDLIIVNLKPVLKNGAIGKCAFYSTAYCISNNENDKAAIVNAAFGGVGISVSNSFNATNATNFGSAARINIVCVNIGEVGTSIFRSDASKLNAVRNQSVLNVALGGVGAVANGRATNSGKGATIKIFLNILHNLNAYSFASNATAMTNGWSSTSNAGNASFGGTLAQGGSSSNNTGYPNSVKIDLMCIRRYGTKAFAASVSGPQGQRQSMVWSNVICIALFHCGVPKTSNGTTVVSNTYLKYNTFQGAKWTLDGFNKPFYTKGLQPGHTNVIYNRPSVTKPWLPIKERNLCKKNKHNPCKKKYITDICPIQNIF